MVSPLRSIVAWARASSALRAIQTNLPVVGLDRVKQCGLIGQFKPSRIERARNRLSRFSFFNEGEYLRLHPDVITMDRSLHFLTYGAKEGRQTAPRTYFAKQLGYRIRQGVIGGARCDPAASDSTGDAERSAPRQSFGVYCNSRSNAFMLDIADDLAFSLAAAGARVNRMDEKSDRLARPEICIYVAPHEFFLLGQGVLWAREEVFENAILYCTEQPQTGWFWRGLPYALLCRGVIDMSPYVAHALAEVMPAAHIYPGSLIKPVGVGPLESAHPLMRSQAPWPASRRLADPLDTWSERPLDLAFFGAATPQREAVFARHAETFARYKSFIYVRRDDEPLNGVTGNLANIADYICANSRITLNVHRDEFGYFEWHRMVRQGMALGSVVVSDTCMPHPLFLAGEHFFMESSRHIGELVRWILENGEGREAAQRMRARCFDLLNTRLSPVTAGRQIIRFCVEALT